ncbi:MAG: quercetin dioxygenase-like cupin family protein [Woeseiaceae bacterium]|jgi:quercetin dioxygenase-like cupin family protein|tara:strand:+ start:5453 stop:5830 length:378 start_codon:yes stop_codon:yes gene_type:complete
MTKKAKLYNWDTIEGEEVRPGVSRKGFRGDQFMMVMNTLEPGMEINPHSHPFEQAVYIVQGKVRFHIGDEVFEGGPGSVIRIPPNIEHYAEPFGDEPVLNLDIFAPLREDYMHLVDYQNFDESEV